MKILVLNSGSSSQKSALYEIKDNPSSAAPAPLWQASIDWEASGSVLRVRTDQGETLDQPSPSSGRKAALEEMLSTLWSGRLRVLGGAAEVDVVGHRIVHGGPKLYDPIFISPEVKKSIADVAVFAPLHNRAELDGIELIEEVFPQVPQVAVFDTGFHHELPLPAALYAGPYDWYEQGIRRYGFHGINHQYCAQRAAVLLGRDPDSLRLISCHLGNGCSLAAIRSGKSVDTTMGFTPLDGLMMGTRSGSVDPGILTYLMRKTAVPGEELDSLLNQKSGLLGISGISGDLREVETAIQEGHTRAKLAFDMFVHRLRKGIGAMASVLGGMDALIFTAGMGEHSPGLRAATCQNLDFLGVQLDPARNAESPADTDISAPGSDVRVLIIQAQEDWAIARECWGLLKSGSAN